jgi:hypothetical protein
MDRTTRNGTPVKTRDGGITRGVTLIALADAHGKGMIRIRVGKTADDYYLSALPSDIAQGERGYHVDKVFGDDSQRYDVLLRQSGRHSCECLGFLRWGHCKHVEALVALTGFPVEPPLVQLARATPRRAPLCRCGEHTVHSADGYCCPECDYWSAVSDREALADEGPQSD